MKGSWAEETWHQKSIVLLALTVLCQSLRAASTNGALGFEGATRPGWGIGVFWRFLGILMAYLFTGHLSSSWVLTGLWRLGSSSSKSAISRQMSRASAGYKLMCPWCTWLWSSVELGGAALVCPCSPLGLHDVWRGNLQVAARFLLMLLMYANLRILSVFCYDTHTHTYTFSDGIYLVKRGVVFGGSPICRKHHN